MVDVAPYTDADPITARGTPMARPKIGDSIVDVIGRTPMVRFIAFSLITLDLSTALNFQTEIITRFA